MRSYLLPLALLIIVSLAIGIVTWSSMGREVANQDHKSSGLPIADVFRYSNVAESKPVIDVSPILAKWAPSMVEATCTFRTLGVTRTGAGMLYANALRTHGLVLLNSNVTQVGYGGELRSFDDCTFRLQGGGTYDFLYNGNHLGMVAGSNEKDGVFWIYIDALGDAAKAIVATTDDLCVHQPLPGDQVVLLGISDHEIVTTKSSIVAEQYNVSNIRGFSLGTVQPSLQGLSAVIDARRNCYLGVLSQTGSIFMTFVHLGG